MWRRVLGHVRGQLVAYVALFVALGGSALAASGLPADSVGTAQLKDRAVTGQKVARQTITGANIVLSTLGPVPDAARLGGHLPSAWQRRVRAGCASGSAIDAINRDGSVGCQRVGMGTLTGIGGVAGSGIIGGGTSGHVWLGINRSVIQHRLTSGCPAGEAISAVGAGGKPTCRAFGSGDGTITGVSAGTDLTGGGSSGNVTINADETKLQHRLTSGCASGQAITAVGQDGTPSCQPFGSGNGTITGVSAGTGLTGGGSSGGVSLAIDPNYRLPQSCTASQLVRWSGTAWACIDDLGATSWQLTGNAGTDPAIDYLGTSDKQPLMLKTDAIQALELQPPGDSSQPSSPNLIGGSSGNNVSAGVSAATIGGGGNSGSPNSVTGDFGTVSGGVGNTAGLHGTVGGGTSNTASGDDSTASGDDNTSSGGDSTSSGGANVASAFGSTAFGSLNTASGRDSTALGNNNTASGDDSTASGDSNLASGLGALAVGVDNTVNGESATALGAQNDATADNATASGFDSVASGFTATALGYNNTAGGANSTALGERALVPSADNNSFVWSDGTTSGAPYFTHFSATNSMQFDALASNGFNMQLSAPGATFDGCTLTSGSAGWQCTSDRNAKHAFEPISDQAILRGLAVMPIESWTYKLDPRGTRHIGPTAQAFKAAFHIGNSSRMIGTLDEGGVALASIQGLYRVVESQQATIKHQQAEIDCLMAHVRAH